MISVNEFLRMKAPALDQKVIAEWQHDVDSEFVNYVLEHHKEFDYQHLRAALRMLQTIYREDVRAAIPNLINGRCGYKLGLW